MVLPRCCSFQITHITIEAWREETLLSETPPFYPIVLKGREEVRRVKGTYWNRVIKTGTRERVGEVT